MDLRSEHGPIAFGLAPGSEMRIEKIWVQVLSEVPVSHDEESGTEEDG